MFFVQRVNIVDRPTETEQGCDDRSGARPEHEVKAFMDGTADHPFNFFEDAQRVDAFRAPAIEA
jgi:hypothetical protein